MYLLYPLLCTYYFTNYIAVLRLIYLAYNYVQYCYILVYLLCCEIVIVCYYFLFNYYSACTFLLSFYAICLMTDSATYSQVTYSLTVPIAIGLLLYMDFFVIIINQSNKSGQQVAQLHDRYMMMMMMMLNQSVKPITYHTSLVLNSQHT